MSNDSNGNPGTPLLVPIEAGELFTPSASALIMNIPPPGSLQE
jgi:hypothetical protein